MSYNAQDSLLQQSHLIYNDGSAAVEKLWSGGGDFHQQQGLCVLCMCYSANPC